jgi:hypothetical protein
MEDKTAKPNIKEDARSLRKKTKRIEESRCLIKAKNREKGKIIKLYQDRQTELECSRDQWKIKCKQEEIERMELSEKYKHIAALFEMKEEQLREILREHEELKKKYPEISQRAKKNTQNR